jgi:hypothetical protein
MQMFRSDPELKGAGYPIIGIDSGSIAKADAVYADSNGYLAVITTSSKVLGFGLENHTQTSTNSTVALYCPLYVPALGEEVIYTGDQACTQTDIGAYADMGTITSGAQVLNLAAGTQGQFFVLGFDAVTTTLTVVEVAEPQVLAFAQV